MKSSIPDLDLKNEHLTNDDLAGIVINYIAPVFAGHQLNFAGQPFSQITLLTCFEDAFPPSWQHQAEGIKAIFDEHLPDVEMSPQEIRQIVAQYKKQIPGSRHRLEPILESLSDDPKMVAAQVVAVQGSFSRVKDDKLTLFFRRPPQDATLAQRLAHISGLPEEDISIGHGQPNYEFDNFFNWKCLLDNVNMIAAHPKSGLNRVYPWPRALEFAGFVETRDAFREASALGSPPDTIVPELYQAAALIGYFKNGRMPYDVLGFLPPQMTTEQARYIAEGAFYHGSESSWTTASQMEEQMSQYLNDPQGQMTTTILAQGLAEVFDNIINSVPSDYLQTYACLYRACILGDQVARNSKTFERLSEEGKVNFFNFFLVSKTLESLKMLMPEKFSSLVPERNIQTLNTVQKWLRHSYN